MIRSLIKTADEKCAYICTQRNHLELELRKMVKRILQIAYQSESAAKEAVVKKIYGGDTKNTQPILIRTCLTQEYPIFILKV